MTCGKGYSERAVKCRVSNVNQEDFRCDASKRPLHRRPCSIGPCPTTPELSTTTTTTPPPQTAKWRYGSWTEVGYDRFVILDKMLIYFYYIQICGSCMFMLHRWELSVEHIDSISSYPILWNCVIVLVYLSVFDCLYVCLCFYLYLSLFLSLSVWKKGLMPMEKTCIYVFILSYVDTHNFGK